MAGHSFCVLWLLVTLLSTCRGMIQLNGVFTDHMVLQRDHAGLPPVRIFGLAYTNETIVIEWGDGIDITSHDNAILSPSPPFSPSPPLPPPCIS